MNFILCINGAEANLKVSENTRWRVTLTKTRRNTLLISRYSAYAYALPREFSHN